MDSHEFHNHQTINITHVGDDFVSVGKSRFIHTIVYILDSMTQLHLGLDGTVQFFQVIRLSKKEKGKTKTKVSMTQSDAFKHPFKINSAAVIVQEDCRMIAIADVGSVVFLYNFP